MNTKGILIAILALGSITLINAQQPAGYFFKEFTPGKVLLKNKQFAKGKFNYDCINDGGNLAASKIRNLECPSYEICLIDYGCGKFNRKIHIMEQYP